MEIRHYSPPSWFEPAGLRAKMALICAKGLPDVKGWRFITLTTSRDLPPAEAYLYAKSRMRNFIGSLRELLGCPDARFCWKLEFHSDGFAHWHMIFECKRKLTVDELRIISELWGLGRTNVKMASDVFYLFKYALKGQKPPDWFLDFYEESSAGERPLTFSGVRFWQVSTGKTRFYTGKPTPVPSVEPQSCRLPFTVRELLQSRAAKFIFVSTDKFGRYLVSRVLPVDSVDTFIRSIGHCLFSGEAIKIPRGYLCPYEKFHSHIVLEIDKLELCQLQKKHQRSVPVNPLYRAWVPF